MDDIDAMLGYGDLHATPKFSFMISKEMGKKVPGQYNQSMMRPGITSPQNTN